MPKISRNGLGEYNKSCSVPHQESSKIEFVFLRFIYDFLEVFKGLQVYPCCADGPLERFGDSQLSPWAPGRRRSVQNPANRQQCPAGHGRGKGMRVLGARFSGLLGAEASPARSCGGDGRWQPRYALLRRSGAMTTAKGERRAWVGARGGAGVVGRLWGRAQDRVPRRRPRWTNGGPAVARGGLGMRED
jgi:hypothetical protein